MHLTTSVNAWRQCYSGASQGVVRWRVYAPVVGEKSEHYLNIHMYSRCENDDKTRAIRRDFYSGDMFGFLLDKLHFLAYITCLQLIYNICYR